MKFCMKALLQGRQTKDPGNSPTFEFIDDACPVCDFMDYVSLGFRGGEAHRYGLGQKVSIVRCSSCTHVYPKPMPYLLDTGQGYGDADEYFRYHNPAREVQLSIRVLQRLRRLGAGSRLLDVGSGRGWLLHAAETLGFSATGVEPSTEFAETARRDYGVTVVAKPLHEARYPDSSFDVVTLGAVLEHVYRPVELLGEIARVLTPGGLVWFEVPNEGSLYCYFAERYTKLQHAQWSGRLSPTFEPYHVQGFTIRSACLALQRVSLDPIDVRTLRGSVPPVRAKSLRQRVELGAESLIHAVAGMFPHKAFNLEVIAKKRPSRQVTEFCAKSTAKGYTGTNGCIS
jgi:SAM-dependent methyltransferase